MNNAGIRDTARALHISINEVVRTLKNARRGRSLLYPLIICTLNSFAKLMNSGLTEAAGGLNKTLIRSLGQGNWLNLKQNLLLTVQQVVAKPICSLRWIRRTLNILSSN